MRNLLSTDMAKKPGTLKRIDKGQSYKLPPLNTIYFAVVNSVEGINNEIYYR